MCCYVRTCMHHLDMDIALSCVVESSSCIVHGLPALASLTPEPGRDQDQRRLLLGLRASAAGTGAWWTRGALAHGARFHAGRLHTKSSRSGMLQSATLSDQHQNSAPGAANLDPLTHAGLRRLAVCLAPLIETLMTRPPPLRTTAYAPGSGGAQVTLATC